MFPDALLYGSMLAVAAAYLASLAYFHRLREDRAPASAEASPGAGSDVVECPECGAENQPGYRFCQRCVVQLPGTASARASFGRPDGRGIL